MGVFHGINIHMEESNTLTDINDLASKISSKSTSIQALRKKLDLFNSALAQLESYRYPIKVVFFGKSITFRVGASSIKDIKLPGINGLTDGFKTKLKDDFVSDFLQIINSGTTSLNKHKLVVLAAGYYILFKRNLVSNEADKSIKAELSQIIQTSTELSQLKRSGNAIILKLGKETYKIDEFKKILGTPKADAAFYYQNKPVVYLSLKKGSGPGNFQQYGGWAGDLGIKTRYDVKGKPIFESFVTRVENIFANLGLVPDQNGRFNFNDLKKGSYFGEPVTNSLTEYKVKFGKDYTPYSPYGINNVHALIDGDIKFKFVQDHYTLDGQYHFELNPNLETTTITRPTNEEVYKPVLIVYKSESQGLNQGGFSNARAAVWPNNRVAQTAIQKFQQAEQLIKDKQIDKLKETFLK